MQFALMDRRLFVTMKKLDGVFNGEDMVGLLRVHFVEDGGESGRLAGTRWTRHKHDAHYSVTAPALRGHVHTESSSTGYDAALARSSVALPSPASWRVLPCNA